MVCVPSLFAFSLFGVRLLELAGGSLAHSASGFSIKVEEIEANPVFGFFENMRDSERAACLACP